MGEVRFSDSQLAAFLPLPNKNANKYTRGTLHVVGGSAQYPGAAVLAARAAQRCGSGYTHVWCASESVNVVRAGNPSLVVSEWNTEALDAELQRLTSADKHPAAVLIGCGFTGASEQEMQLLDMVLKHRVPVLVDAGGISCLASSVARQGMHVLQQRASAGASLVVTPHAGEAARLWNALRSVQALQKSVNACQNGPAPAAQSAPATQPAREVQPAPSAQPAREAQDISRATTLANFYSATVALKGPRTIVAQQNDVYVMNQGTPALAKAGTGDVLAGMIAAFLAQGLPAFRATALGVHLHACAGKMAAQRLGAISVIPEDVIDDIPCAIQKLLKNS